MLWCDRVPREAITCVCTHICVRASLLSGKLIFLINTREKERELLISLITRYYCALYPDIPNARDTSICMYAHTGFEERWSDLATYWRTQRALRYRDRSHFTPLLCLPLSLSSLIYTYLKKYNNRTPYPTLSRTLEYTQEKGVTEVSVAEYRKK